MIKKNKYSYDPNEIADLKMIFWIGFNEAKKYKCEWQVHWNEKQKEAYMEGQEKWLRHKLNEPMVRWDDI